MNNDTKRIQELEALLNSESDEPVYVTQDGRIVPAFENAAIGALSPNDPYVRIAELEAQVKELEAELASCIRFRHSDKSERDAALSALRTAAEALAPFAKLRVSRFMTDGLRYDYRLDSSWLRRARTAHEAAMKVLEGANE